MSAPVLEPLAPGAIDIVGDVHGELDALDTLLRRLGYDDAGRHPDGRKLVFVGDLVDRGPDSPGVVERVMRYVAAGAAQCILGNHEMNLLRGLYREGNAWFTRPGHSAAYPAAAATDTQRRRILAFLATLPLALERDDLRVVHACWDESALRRILGERFATLDEAYRHFESAVRAELANDGTDQRCQLELRAYGARLDDRDVRPPFMPARAELDTRFQMHNPVRLLTSGPEAPAEAPFWAAGRWRMVQRERWWEEYDDPKPVVIGHYWRRYAETQTLVGDKDAADVFDGIRPHHWMGRRANVYCVDFSVGGRPAERMRGSAPPFLCKLAALRVPEWHVVHDDGETWDIGPPGG